MRPDELRAACPWCGRYHDALEHRPRPWTGRRIIQHYAAAAMFIRIKDARDLEVTRGRS